LAGFLGHVNFHFQIILINRDIEDAISMTFKTCKSGQLDKILVARSGEYARTQRASLWGVVPNEGEIIPEIYFRWVSLDKLR
jgi:hypothetical protein